jgi:hypothetical protein
LKEKNAGSKLTKFGRSKEKRSDAKLVVLVPHVRIGVKLSCGQIMTKLKLVNDFGNFLNYVP